MALEMYDHNNPCVRCPLWNDEQCDDPFCNENRNRRLCAFRDHPRGRARYLELTNPTLANWSA